MDAKAWQFENDVPEAEEYLPAYSVTQEYLPAYSVTRLPLTSADNIPNGYADRSFSYARSFSHPPERPYHPSDINKAIHDEIMSSPWGSTGRRQKRRNRYAVYFPEGGSFESLGQFYDNECFQNGGLKSLFETDPSDYSGNVYATYRRAPRTYPRLDTVNIVHNDISDDPMPISRRQNADTHYDQFLPKLANDAVNNSERNVNGGHNIYHNPAESQSGVQHLFSIRLDDVKQMNAMENERAETKGNSCEKIKSRVLNFVSNKCKRRKSGDKRRSSQSTGDESKKPFFYCRWITDYPKTFFCKYILVFLKKKERFFLYLYIICFAIILPHNTAQSFF